MKSSEEFVQVADMSLKEPHIRYGQYLMNHLFKYDETAYRHIMKVGSDPFYDDKKIADFFTQLDNYYS